MFDQNRHALRQLYFNTWDKYQRQQPLTALEQNIATVLAEHPEYHFIFNAPDQYVEKDFFPELGESNPFLHLSLHLSVREQIATNRPAGIQAIFQTYCKNQSPHHAEHLMIDSLAETLWLAQKNQQMPDEDAYLEKLKLAIK